MSKEKAKKFYDEVISKDVQNEWAKMSAKQMEEVILKDDLGFTLAEIKEVIKDSVMSQKISDSELDMALGGMHSGGHGGCTSDYYAQQCTDTVEYNSSCVTGDYCERWSSTYTCAQPHV